MKSSQLNIGNSIGRRGMSRVSLVLGGLMWAGVIAGLVLVWQNRQTRVRAQQAPSTAETPISPDQKKPTVKLSFPAKELPDFEFDEVMGGKLSRADLKGRRWVASFVFSRCTTSCPMISAAVMRLHERIEESAPDVVFVTITVDPKWDTVEVFREYSETFTKGKRNRWKFLTGSQQEIFELVVKGFGLYVKENLGESRLPGFEVAHTNRVVLVNEDGFPVGTFLGTSPQDMLKLRRILTGRDEFPEPGKPGLTFSTADGSPLQIEFKVQPAGTPQQKANAEEAEQEVSPDGDGEPSEADNSQPEDSDPGDAQARGDLVAPGSSAPLTAAENNALIDSRLPVWAQRLPPINAGLNTLAALFLTCGLGAIRSGRKQLHRNLMITAFVTSAVFLGCYLTYHYVLGQSTGEHGRQFRGGGIAAAVYPFILWPHVGLAACVPVLAIRVFQHAFAGRWDAHKRLAKFTFPVWIYVSVSGVVIYGMLYHWPAEFA